MSDELRKHEDTEVEGHLRKPHANDQLAEETEVEGHLRKPHANDQPAEESEDDEVEAHLRKHGNVRMD